MDENLLYGKECESIPCDPEHRARYIILNEFVVSRLGEILHYKLAACFHVRILCRDDRIGLDLEFDLKEPGIIGSDLKSAAVFKKIIERSYFSDNLEIRIDVACQNALRERLELLELAG